MSITPESLAKSGTEHGMQAAVFAWSVTSGIPELKWLFAIPNGFFGSAAQKGKMKAEGLRSGVADIMLPISRVGAICFENKNNEFISNKPLYYCGLFVEMKQEKYRGRHNGGLSDEQEAFAHFVTGQGYKFMIAYTWIEAKDGILNYLGK